MIWNKLVFAVLLTLLGGCTPALQTASAPTAAPTKASAEKPNVLLLMVDDMNDWVKAFGGYDQAITPNLDRFAAKGVRFDNAYCTTLVELAGLPTNTKLDGNSLAGWLGNQNTKLSNFAVTGKAKDMQTLRTATHRYIRYGDGAEELYDHRVDPMEWKNLVKNPASAQVLAKLRQQLIDYEASMASK